MWSRYLCFDFYHTLNIQLPFKMKINSCFLSNRCIPFWCVLLCLAGCNTSSEINYPLKYEGDKLILLAQIQQNEEIVVQVLRTSPPLDPFYRDSFYISNAEVKLYENDTIYLLQYIGNGLYEISEHHIAQSGNVYKIEASAPGFTLTYSDWETVPNPGVISNVDWSTIVTESQYDGRLSLKIDLPGDTPFELFLNGMAGSEKLSPYYEIVEGIGLYCGGTTFIPECLTLEGEIIFEVDREYFNGSVELIITDLIPVLTIISESQKKYDESVALQSDANDYPFIANTSPYTNIHNGYGLLSTSAAISVSIPIN